jgi:hypothetical protein
VNLLETKPLSEALVLYKESREMFNMKDNTWQDYLDIIDFYVIKVGPNSLVAVYQDLEYLRSYVLDPNTNNQRLRYYSVKKFYNFIEQEVLNLPKKDRSMFPIDENELNIEAGSPRRKSKDVGIHFLDEDFFDYNLFFDDEYHIHLKNKNVIATAKAAIALMLFAAYPSSQIDSTSFNSRKERMLLDDYQDIGENWMRLARTS